jgi:2-iminobutanoate/2-iminopropanoate deaminase
VDIIQYDPRRPYARASRVGDLLFLAGEAGYQGHSRELVSGGIAEQSRQALRNIDDTLSLFELGFEHLVKMDVFLLDSSDKAAFMEVLGEFASDGSPPGALVAVKGFAHEGVLVEVECVAAIERDRTKGG